MWENQSMPIHVRESWLSSHGAVYEDSLFDLRHNINPTSRSREEFGAFCGLVCLAAHQSAPQCLKYLLETASALRFCVNRRNYPANGKSEVFSSFPSVLGSRPVYELVCALPGHPWTRLTGRLPHSTVLSLYAMAAASALGAGHGTLCETLRASSGESPMAIWALLDPRDNVVYPAAILPWVMEHLPVSTRNMWLSKVKDTRPEFKAAFEKANLEDTLNLAAPNTGQIPHPFRPRL
jgi:hypothetical protein